MNTLFLLLFLASFICLIIGLTKPATFSRFIKGKSARKNIGLIFGIATLVFFILYVATANTSDKKTTTQSPSSTKTTASQESKTVEPKIAAAYKTVATEDLSMKALGNKKLSDYSSSEISKLPTDKRYQFRIVIEKNLDQDSIKKIIESLISDKRSEDSDIDELTIFIYDDEKDAKEPYTIGKAIWSPGGVWGSVTPEIASSNNRANYITNYEFVTKTTTNTLTDREKEIRNDYNNKLDELLAKQTEWSSDSSTDDAINKELEDYIMKKYSITKDELDKIMVKGLIQ
ncbi:MAG: hypothetical protein NTZ65_02230 [Candidatus Berkelbacteria bacterium]|nr:hypothetical protein [Candidatus Berkelbacteria bacterium]